MNILRDPPTMLRTGDVAVRAFGSTLVIGLPFTAAAMAAGMANQREIAAVLGLAGAVTQFVIFFVALDYGVRHEA